MIDPEADATAYFGVCVHCGSTGSPLHFAAPWSTRFAEKTEGMVRRCVSENQCERREKRKRGRTTLRERLPVGTRVCINGSDLDEYIGETGTVIGHDEPSNDLALVSVRFDTAVGSFEHDAFYEAELSLMGTRSYEGYMGSRSDVVVMLKRDLDALVPEDGREAWFRDATRHGHAKGFAYVWRDVKWYPEWDEDLKQLYAWLAGMDDSDFEIIAASHDYPESSGYDRGGWSDNPWNARKDVTVSVDLLLDIPTTAVEESGLENGLVEDGELHEVYTAREIAAMLKVVIAERDDARAKLSEKQINND